MQLVAAVHHEVQRADLRVPVERHDVARPGDEALAVLETLTGLVGIEAPQAGVLLEQGARLLAGRALRPILRLTRIRRSADVDVQVAGVVEREALESWLRCAGASARPFVSVNRRIARSCLAA